MKPSISKVTRRAVMAAAVCTALVPAAWARELPKVSLETGMGVIVIQLEAEKAPKTVENFLKYVADGHYDGTIFHRVIGNFMIQGGGFTPDMQQKKTRDPVPLEIAPDLKNDRGTVAMARTANPNSATSQFFINVVNNDGLNAPKPDGYGYAVFGKVVQGMDVVDRIKAVSTGRRAGQGDVPLEPVVIKSARIVK